MMKYIIHLCLFLMFAIGAEAQYYGVEINATDKNPKDCGRVKYTAKKLYYYWPSKDKYSAGIKPYDWTVSHASNGRPESIGNAWISNAVNPVPGNNYVVSQDDGTLAVEGEGDTLHIYDLVTTTKTKAIALGNIDDYEMSGDGSFLAVARNGKVDLIDVVTEKIIHTISAEAEELKFSPGDQFLALIRTHEVEIFNLWSGQSIKLEDFGFVRACEMSVNGRIMIPHKSKYTLSYDVFDMRTGKKLRKTIKRENSDWYYYSIHPRGEVIQVQGDFYNLKSKNPFHTSSYDGFKFHPFLPGVFVGKERKGRIGTYYFKD